MPRDPGGEVVPRLLGVVGEAFGLVEGGYEI